MDPKLQIMLGLCAVGGSAATIGYFGSKVFFASYDSYESLALRTINEELDQVYVFMDPSRFFHLSMLLSGLGFLLGFAVGGANLVSGIFLGVIFAAICFLLPRIVVRIRLQKRQKQIGEQLPEALDMLSSSLRANLTLQKAIERATARLKEPISQELGVIAQEAKLGYGIATCITHWADRTQLMDINIIAAATDVSVRAGGNLAETYDNLGQLIRDRLMFEREMGAMTAEGRMQGIVMALLPAVILGLMSLINSQMMLPFITSQVGLLLLLLVAFMQIAAYFWIKKITDIEY